MPQTYDNFDLLLVPQAGRYASRVIASPAGQAVSEFALPLTLDDMQSFWQQAARSARHISTDPAGAPETQDRDPKDFGARLFTAVFAGQVGQTFLRSLDEARRSGRGLRIRLRLGDTPELDSLPWEFLYAPELGRFLAPSDETPLVRYLELAQPERPLVVKPPLHILAVVSDPSDAPALNGEQEWSNLQSALRELETQHQVALHRLEAATLPTLQQALRRQEFHIIHFIGHGYFDAQANTGGLVFVGDSGQSLHVTADQLAALLHDQRTLRLIFLNACEGARSGSLTPFAGVAQKLVQQTVPAVLAMQFPVSDAAAIALSKEFYLALADGLAIDQAVGEARKALFAGGERFEWGTPALFSRSPDGIILAKLQDQEQPVEATPSPLPQPQAQPWWHNLDPTRDIHAQGDVIIATIGAGASNVAVGKNITQQVAQTVGPATPDDRQIVQQKLREIEAALAAQPASAATGQVAHMQLQLLAGELTKTQPDETPSAGAITIAGNWLLDNLPALKDTLTRLFATPAVGRVLAKAGDAAVEWALARFGAR